MRNHKRKARRLNAAARDSLKYGDDIFVGGTHYRGHVATYTRKLEKNKETGVMDMVIRKATQAIPFVRVD